MQDPSYESLLQISDADGDLITFEELRPVKHTSFEQNYDSFYDSSCLQWVFISFILIFFNCYSDSQWKSKSFLILTCMLLIKFNFFHLNTFKSIRHIIIVLIAFDWVTLLKEQGETSVLFLVYDRMKINYLFLRNKNYTYNHHLFCIES